MAVGQGWVTKAIIYKAFYRDIDLFFFSRFSEDIARGKDGVIRCSVSLCFAPCAI